MLLTTNKHWSSARHVLGILGGIFCLFGWFVCFNREKGEGCGVLFWVFVFLGVCLLVSFLGYGWLVAFFEGDLGALFVCFVRFLFVWLVFLIHFVDCGGFFGLVVVVFLSFSWT